LASPILVIHEWLGFWGRQLRPRFLEASVAVRIIETRSSEDLSIALDRAERSLLVVLIDSTGRTLAGLEDLGRVMLRGWEPLVLFIDSSKDEKVESLARELGATHVISGSVTPPAVATLLVRWLRLTSSRAEAEGWIPTPPRTLEPEPWNWLTSLMEEETTDYRALGKAT
jgi:hypothetical protein